MKTANITVRRVPEDVKHALRLRAAARGRSLEEEVRQILMKSAREAQAPPLNLAEAIAALVDPIGGVELDLPERPSVREPPRFDDWPDDET